MVAQMAPETGLESRPAMGLAPPFEIEKDQAPVERPGRESEGRMSSPIPDLHTAAEGRPQVPNGSSMQRDRKGKVPPDAAVILGFLRMRRMAITSAGYHKPDKGHTLEDGPATFGLEINRSCVYQHLTTALRRANLPDEGRNPDLFALLHSSRHYWGHNPPLRPIGRLTYSPPLALDG